MDSTEVRLVSGHHIALQCDKNTRSCSYKFSNKLLLDYIYHKSNMINFRCYVSGCFDEYPSRCNGSYDCHDWPDWNYCRKTCGTCYCKYFVEFYSINIILLEMHQLVSNSVRKPVGSPVGSRFFDRPVKPVKKPVKFFFVATKLHLNTIRNMGLHTDIYFQN